MRRRPTKGSRLSYALEIEVDRRNREARTWFPALAGPLVSALGNRWRYNRGRVF